MDQRTRDLELLRQARGEVVQLEEIRKKIRGVADCLKKCEDKRTNGVDFKALSTSHEADLKVMFDEKNKTIRNDKEMMPVLISWGVLIVLIILSFVFLNKNLVSEYDAGRAFRFWVADIVLIILFAVIPAAFTSGAGGEK